MLAAEANNQNSFVQQEEQRLADICNVVDQNVVERKKKLAAHDSQIRQYEKERLASVNPREKDRLTVEIRRLSQFDPAKYLPPFEQESVPYLAGLSIKDDDPKIGTKHLLFGKQGLMDGNKAVVIDWRKAEISTLYYEWDEGEEYEEEIGGRERTGLIEKKISYGIRHRELLSITTGGETFQKDGGDWGLQSSTNQSAARKESTGDHRLVDIISLISREQFNLITKKHDGCLYLTGGAGSGKTTVAIHRLSYLGFNYPEAFRPQRCLVVMFNRSLCDYVRQTSTDLLTDKMPVETFHTWAAKALQSYGCRPNFSARQGKGLGPVKKSTGMYRALVKYVENSMAPQNPYHDLGAFYISPEILEEKMPKHKGGEDIVTDGQRFLNGSTELSFDDAGIFLHLLQLRSGSHEYTAAWYDHILIDEAQDLSITELKALYHATDERRSMTICADEKQKILDFVDTKGFSSFQMDLESQGLCSGVLGVSYRSTAQIMDFASRVSGRKADKVVNEGPDPRFHTLDTKEQALDHLERTIKTLLSREPKSLTAIICRYKKEAQEIFGKLKGVAGVRLQTSSLTFEPGVMITNAHQVKGLEFGGVIVWNPTPKNYPDTAIGRNLLYVALTRASNRLAFYCYEPVTPLLRQP
jgi:DNA helicase IV